MSSFHLFEKIKFLISNVTPLTPVAQKQLLRSVVIYTFSNHMECDLVFVYYSL